MNPQKEAAALKKIENAISILEAQKSLDTEELVAKYYVERESKFINKLKKEIRLSKGRTIKILFSGHMGSGKSSELFKLKEDLQDEFLSIYYSIKEYMNLFGIDVSALIETIAVQLRKIFEEKKIKLKEDSKDIIDKLDNWKSRERQTQYREEKRAGKAGIGGSLVVAEARGELHSEKGTKTEKVWEQEPDINNLIMSLNRLIKNIQEETKKELIIIIDDIDKLDLADAENLFLRYSRTMTALNCKIIYTVPISLLYSHHYRQFESFYHRSYLLPISRVKNKDGSDNEAGIREMQKIIAKRISPKLFAEGALKKAILASGGIIRDAIRIIQECCLICVTENKPMIHEAAVNEAISSIKNEFLRQIPKDLYPKLIEVKNSPSKKPDNDQELQKLLYCLGVLEYINDDTWYDVHPLALELAEQKEKELRAKEEELARSRDET
ncbi:MAG: AAA family ATPase [Candidatus Aminicenantes bacterium]|nr:AAA family ATPase [Candidatus Aminicenantes bacterium]